MMGEPTSTPPRRTGVMIDSVAALGLVTGFALSVSLAVSDSGGGAASASEPQAAPAHVIAAPETKLLRREGLQMRVEAFALSDGTVWERTLVLDQGRVALIHWTDPEGNPAPPPVSW